MNNNTLNNLIERANQFGINIIDLKSKPLDQDTKTIIKEN